MNPQETSIPKTGESVFRLLIELNQMKGVTLIMVTHNMNLANQLPRQIRLIDGKARDQE